jgi:serine/threonine protein kinase
MTDGTCPRCGRRIEPSGACPACGILANERVLTAGAVLRDRYEIQRVLHTGGMGRTYVARDRTLFGRPCVVKQVAQRIQSDHHRRQLEEEALRMAGLSHPGIAMILDQFVEQGYYYLVVELVIGKTLSEVSKERRGRLGEAEVVRWGVLMCDVVAYIHGQGIVHRDISPDNVMVTEDGAIKFIDFGTLREARYVAAGKTAGMGKYGYTPPEQWEARTVPQSDVFALGATLYHLLTGFLPLSPTYLAGGKPEPEDYAPSFPSIRELEPRISPRLESVLMKALQLDPAGRYASALDMQTDLRIAAGLELRPRASRWRPVTDSLQHPLTELAMAGCVIAVAYVVILAPIYGWTAVAVAAAVICGAGAAISFWAKYGARRIRAGRHSAPSDDGAAGQTPGDSHGETVA